MNGDDEVQEQQERQQQQQQQQSAAAAAVVSPDKEDEHEVAYLAKVEATQTASLVDLDTCFCLLINETISIKSVLSSWAEPWLVHSVGSEYNADPDISASMACFNCGCYEHRARDCLDSDGMMEVRVDISARTNIEARAKESVSISTSLVAL